MNEQLLTVDGDAVEKTDVVRTILVCGSSSYYSAVAVSETDTTTDADVVTAVSGSSYYFSAVADLVMDADVVIEILFAANLFCKAGQHAPSFFWKKLDCLAPFFLTKSFF